MDIQHPLDCKTRLGHCLSCCRNEVQNLVDRKDKNGASRTDLLCSLITFNDKAAVVIDKEPIDAAFAARFGTLVEGIKPSGGRTNYHHVH